MPAGIFMHHIVEKVMNKILHVLEYIIAWMMLIVLVGMVGKEVDAMCTDAAYFSSLDTFLHNILTIVVGLEFVRMLVDLTPANTLAVLIVAISRQVIISHDNPLSNVASVACIAGLFAIRRFLIRKKELKVEMSEVN